MVKTLIARRISDNLAWARRPDDAKVWAEIRKLWPAADDAFVRGLYPAVLGRPADDGELRHGLRYLGEGGQRADLVRLVATSEEARRARLDTSWLPRLISLTEERCWAELLRLWPQPDDLFVRGVYELLLLRPPDQRDLLPSLNFLRSGNSRAEFVRLLTASEEFAALGLPASWLEKLPWLTEQGLCQELLRAWGEADEPFVRRLFELFLHRPPLEKEVADNLTLLRGGCARLDLAQALATGPEARELRRDGSWFEALEARLSEETWAGLLRLWAEPDELFVRGVYRLLLHRPADPAALLTQVTALRGRTGRASLVASVAASDEGRRMACGRSWLAWLDSPRGRRELAQAVGCRPTDDSFIREFLRRLPVNPESAVFVRRAYQEIMGRQPTAEELQKQTWRLRYFPFYTRAVFLRRLLRFRDQLRAA